MRRPDPDRGLRKLPRDLDELARGTRDRLRSPRGPRQRIEDTRVSGLIPGVANYQARLVYDARLSRLRQAHAAGSDAPLAELLCEAVLLGIWRARSVTGFDAFVHDAAGIARPDARALAEQGAAQRGLVLERLPDVAVATWLRAEGALLQSCPDAAVEVHVRDGQLRFALRMPISPPARVAETIAAIGRAVAGLESIAAGPSPPMGRKSS